MRKTHETGTHGVRIYTELPDWTFRLVHIFGDEEAVIVEFDGSGHFSGTYKSMRYVRAPLRLSAVCIFGLSDGLILSVREYFDHVYSELGWGERRA